MSIGRASATSDVDVDRTSRGRAGSGGTIPPPGREAARSAGGRKGIIVSIGLLFVTFSLVAVTRPFATHTRAGGSSVLPGLTLEDVAKPRSVVVTSVQGNSIADDSGIKVGDRVVAIDAHPIASRADVMHYLDGRHPRVVDMQLARGGRPVELRYAFLERKTL